MSSIKRAVVAGLALAVMTTSAIAQVSATYADWGKGPAQFLMTQDEAKQWKSVKNDEQAKAFVELFWARRDPTPATIGVNEYKAAFEARVETADKYFTQGKKKGSMTELGRVMVVLGAPTKIARSSKQPTSTIQTPTTDMEGRTQAQDYSPKQVWHYDQAKAEFKMDQPTLEINFIDQYGTNDWTLERGAKADINAVLQSALAQAITQPNLTEAPKVAAQPAKPVAAPTAPATTAAGAIKSESLKSAIAEFKAAGGKGAYKSASFDYTELVSPTGESYIPLQLYIPKSAELTAQSVTTFFGIIENAEGAQVLTFEEPATLSVSGGDLYFDKAITIAPGKYTATLGLAGADGKPVVLTTSPMEILDYNKSTVGVSRLVLARDIHETETAAPAGAAFQFGRLKIVPKGDMVFTNKDEINYFVEIFNPTIAEATQLPKLDMKLDLEGKGKDARKISAPLSEASPLPLSGATGAGQYAIIGSIPLGAMKNPPPPGEYTLRLTIYDKAANPAAKYIVEQKFTLVAAPAAAPAAAAPAK